MDAIMITIVTITTILVIAFARKIENTVLPGALIGINLFLLIYHSFVLNSINSAFIEVYSKVYLYLAMDFLWLLISFLGYLWLDDINAIKFNRKSYDDSFSWLWKKL